jgi:fucose permease
VIKRKTSLFLLILSYLSFVSLGLPDGLNGVAWPSIRAHFNLPVDALGALLVTFTIGYLVSSFSSGRLLSRVGLGELLGLSCAATAISMLGYAVAPAWWMIVGLGTISGLGAGAIDAGLNTFAATEFTARTVNWLHAFYGVGAATGPVIMTRVLASNAPWQRGYAIVGSWQLALGVSFILSRKKWPRTEAPVAGSGAKTRYAATILSTLRLPIVWLSAAMFFVYTGIEAAAGVWAFTLFTEARGVPSMTAGAWISIYWGALTLGRFASGFIAGWIPINAILRSTMIGVIAGAVLVWLNLAEPVSFVGLAFMGSALAPIFPSLIASTPGRTGNGHTRNAVGFQIAAAVLGQSLLPALTGVLAARFGLEIIGPVLVAAAVLLWVMYEGSTSALAKRTRSTFDTPVA